MKSNTIAFLIGGIILSILIIFYFSNKKSRDVDSEIDDTDSRPGTDTSLASFEGCGYDAYRSLESIPRSGKRNVVQGFNGITWLDLIWKNSDGQIDSMSGLSQQCISAYSNYLQSSSVFATT